MGRRTIEERSVLEFLLENALSRKADLVKRGMRIAAELDRVNNEIRDIESMLDE